MIVKDKLEKYMEGGVHGLFYCTIPALPGGTEESHIVIAEISVRNLPTKKYEYQLLTYDTVRETWFDE
jgi:hypothetical protein